jgi:hypothetical protein
VEVMSPVRLWMLEMETIVLEMELTALEMLEACQDYSSF